MRILLVESNRQLSGWLAKALRLENYAIDSVYSAEDALHALGTEEYAVLVLEVVVPQEDGLDMLRQLRARGNAVPVIILAANDTLDGRISGLDAGADDYLAKPFDVSELTARIRVQLRRANFHKNPIMHCGELTLDSNSRQFFLGELPLALTPREQSVLETLIFRAGVTVRKSSLAMSVFGYEDEAHPNAIEIYVHRVRRKLAGSDVGIVTRRGVGYVLKEAPAQQYQSAAV
ncbi:MAG: response regulator [Candidatus Velthaea sp.]